MDFKLYFLKENLLSEWEYIEEILDLCKVLDRIDKNMIKYAEPSEIMIAIDDIIEEINIKQPYFKNFYNNIREHYFKGVKTGINKAITKSTDYRIYCTAIIAQTAIYMSNMYEEVYEHKTVQDWVDYHFTGHPEKKKLEECIFKNLKENFLNAYMNPAQSLKEIKIQKHPDRKVSNLFINTLFNIYECPYVVDYIIMSDLYKVKPAAWYLLTVHTEIEDFMRDYLTGIS